MALLGDALMLQVARRPASRDERIISSVFQKYITNFVKFGYVIVTLLSVHLHLGIGSRPVPRSTKIRTIFFALSN